VKGKDHKGSVIGKVESPSSGNASGEQQVAATGEDTLPFTGFVAIPLLVGGVGLLGAGAGLRRWQRDA
jgi:hypothetical protein